MKAYNEFVDLEIEIANVPKVSFKQIRLASNFGEPHTILGPHSWNRLKSTSDLSLLVGQKFDMKSDDWEVTGCFVCEDRKSIYFQNAMRLK